MGGSDDVTPSAQAEPGAHPLARRLAQGVADAARSSAAPRILLLGVGSGRNLPALLAAGAAIDAVEDDADRAAAADRRVAGDPRVRVRHAAYAPTLPFDGDYAGLLSTHALLHGTRDDVAAALAAARARLVAGALCFFTLGSQSDPRFGMGRAVAPGAFAPESGSEAGIAHAFFDEAGARRLLEGLDLEELSETHASEAVGRWCTTPARRRRSCSGGYAPGCLSRSGRSSPPRGTTHRFRRRGSRRS